MIERAEAYCVECPFTGANWFLQFWDSHQEDRWGRRRMCVAVFQQEPLFPSNYRYLMRSRDFRPGLTMSCDGPEAARAVTGFFVGDDTDVEGLVITNISEMTNDEIHLIF